MCASCWCLHYSLLSYFAIMCVIVVSAPSKCLPRHEASQFSSDLRYCQIIWHRWVSSSGMTGAPDVFLFTQRFKRSAQVRALILSKLEYFISNYAKTSHTHLLSLLHAHSHTCIPMRTNTSINHCEDLSLICIWRLYPTLPQFTPIYYNSIFPVFQSKDLFLLIF